jgi:tetrahydromethanopterin S-methyltransferase subunit A
MAGSDDSKKRKSPLSAAMHAMARMMPADSTGENPRAVQMYRHMTALREALNPRRVAARVRGRSAWPVTLGTYQVGSLTGAIAVCALTSAELVDPLCNNAGVAISGKVYTPNLGIEKIILNVTANPNIRFLLLCGKESPVFFVGQAIQMVFQNGVDGEKRIPGAVGPYPVLVNLPVGLVERFRAQVELVDRMGEQDVPVLAAIIHDLALRSPGRFVAGSAGMPERVEEQVNDADAESQFKPLRPGGHRQPIVYDPKGFVIISIDPEYQEIVVRHYLPDHTPAHIMRGRTAEPLLLGLLREGIVTELSHAGYLGVELTKAEMALKLGKPYEQDKPIGKLVS